MSDTFSFTLKRPLTEEQFNLITDAEFEHTDRIWFDTPTGKHVEFVKAQRWSPCNERLPETGEYYLVTRQYFGWNCTEYREIDIAKCDFDGWNKADVVAWCELPEPYKEGSDD